jgi:hypothetical protein
LAKNTLLSKGFLCGELFEQTKKKQVHFIYCGIILRFWALDQMSLEQKALRTETKHPEHV